MKSTMNKIKQIASVLFAAAMIIYESPIAIYAENSVMSVQPPSENLMDEDAETSDNTSDQTAEEESESSADLTAGEEVEATSDSAAEPEEASAANNRTEFTYTDDKVSVTAVLTDPEAVPAGAEFRVTELSPDFADGAYLDALNESAGEENAFTSENTALYDVGFFVTDEEGNIKETDLAAGEVTLDFQFKDQQLTKLGAESGDEVELIHLPLKDKDHYQTAQDATQITADDIRVDVPEEDKVNVTAGTDDEDTASVTLDNLSVLAAGKPIRRIQQLSSSDLRFTSISVKKEWDNNVAEKEAVEFTLTRKPENATDDQVEEVAVLTFDASGEPAVEYKTENIIEYKGSSEGPWQYTFSNLPMMIDGTKYYYDINENGNEKYIISKSFTSNLNVKVVEDKNGIEIVGTNGTEAAFGIDKNKSVVKADDSKYKNNKDYYYKEKIENPTDEQIKEYIDDEDAANVDNIGIKLKYLLNTYSLLTK